MNYYLLITDVISFSVGIFIPNYKTPLASDFSSNKKKNDKIHLNKANDHQTGLKNFDFIVKQCLQIGYPQDIGTTYLTLNQKQSNAEFSISSNGTRCEKRPDYIFFSNKLMKYHSTIISINLAKRANSSSSNIPITNILNYFGRHPYVNALKTF